MTRPRTGYNGYSVDSEFLQMDWDCFREYCLGELARSFIKNNFEETARKILSQAIAWGMFNDKGI